MDCTRCDEPLASELPFCRCCGAVPASGSSTSPDYAEPNAGETVWGFLISGSQAGCEGHYWPLTLGVVEVGREGTGTEPTVALPHQTVSSAHAVLRCDGLPRRVRVADKHSRNGTFVNGVRLLPERPRVLQDGDRIRFGLYDSVLKIVD